MNEQLKELYNQYLNHSNEERIQVAQAACGVLVQFLKEAGLDEEQSFAFFMNVVRLFVSADRSCSEEEADLFNEILGANVSYEDFFNATNGGANPEFIKAMDELIDSMPEDPKIATCVLGLTFLAADGELTQAEVDVFERILG